jgi:5-methylcytosine-specific restriction endonuclease McrA
MEKPDFRRDIGCVRIDRMPWPDPTEIHDWWEDQETPRERAGRIRQTRLTAAREKGGHFKEHWKILHDIFGRCVSCGIPYDHLNGNAATKDHIEPISFGGCDCLANLQPVCRNCNSSGVMQDCRELALPGWQTILLHRMGAYY